MLEWNRNGLNEVVGSHCLISECCIQILNIWVAFNEILIESYPIKRVSHVKFLGIILDEHLTWRKHIDLVHGKSAKMIGIMRRLKHALPSNTIRTLYNAFILPYFSYGLIVWAGGYKTLLQPLLLLQKKVVRIIAGTHYLAQLV